MHHGPVGLLVVCGLAACSPPAWTHKAALVEANVMLACDLGQTAWLAHGGRWDRPHPEGGAWVETNPLLGARPPVLAVAWYLGMIGLAATMAYPNLPSWARSAVYFTLAGAETANVVTNNHHGVCGL